MPGWEYKVVPAPTKGQKGKGVKGAEARFALALETLMNDMGAEGWEFQRAETLPSIERSGLTGSTTEWRNLLVFRRTHQAPMDDFEPELLPAPADLPEPPTETVVSPEPEVKTTAERTDKPAEFVPGKGATETASEAGDVARAPVSGMTASLQKLAAQRSSAETKD